METMDYNNFNNKKPGIGIIFFMLVIILGGSVIAYALMNEPEPIILGQDAFVNIYIENKTSEVETNTNTEYSVKNKYKTESTGNFKARIVLPIVSISGVEMEQINQNISKNFIDRYESLKNENAKTLENTFTYKTTYKKYYNKLSDGTTILSIVIYEKIIDDTSAKETMSNTYGYNINLAKKEIMTQEETAALVIGSDYSNVLRTQVKNYVIDKKMISEAKYSYSITGLEEFYVRDSKFHIVFNTGQIALATYDQLDIKIVK